MKICMSILSAISCYHSGAYYTIPHYYLHLYDWQTLITRPSSCLGQCWESPQWRSVVHCKEVRRGTACHRRRGWHCFPRRRDFRCGAGPCTARRWLLHGGAELGRTRNPRNCASIRGLCWGSLYDYKTSLFSCKLLYPLAETHPEISFGNSPEWFTTKVR